CSSQARQGSYCASSTWKRAEPTFTDHAQSTESAPGRRLRGVLRRVEVGVCAVAACAPRGLVHVLAGAHPTASCARASSSSARALADAVSESASLRLALLLLLLFRRKPLSCRERIRIEALGNEHRAQRRRLPCPPVVGSLSTIDVRV